MSHASEARSFPPIAAPDARVLILGSMPGVASLEAQRYYAHPRNAFWPIVAQLYGFDARLPYEQRCELLRGAQVAVWDVLRACRREGSLDAAIEKDSEEPNDFGEFLAGHQAIRLIGFNGQKAETAFRRLVVPMMDRAKIDQLTLVRLPSTSPAHAGRSFEEKLADWRAGLTEPIRG